MTSSLFDRLRQRKLVQWGVAYLAGAWLLLQVLDLMAENFAWPTAVERITTVLLGVGLLAVLVLAWYHGERGQQRMSGVELVILTGILLLAGVAVTFVPQEPPTEAPAALFATAGRSVAVLPFTNMSSDKENEYFSDGMTDDILTSLARLSDLKVISRTSVMQYKHSTKPMRQIAQELGAAHVLEGSVRRVGDRVRITAQLIDARTDEHLWAENYDRELRDVLAVQSEIAARISEALHARLSADDQRRLAAGARPVNPAAYEAYLRGKAGKGVPAFEEAIALDPAFAPAYAAIAGSFYIGGFFGFVPPAEAYAKMEEYAELALARDPDLADAHSTIALVRLYRDWDWAAAERHFQRALQLSPSDPGIRHSYAHYLLTMGRTAESAAETRWAAELTPVDAALTACAGWHKLFDRQHQQAVANSLRALQISPDNFWAEMILGWAYEQEGKYTEAVESFRSAVAHSGGSTFARAALGHALAVSGQRQQAREVLRDQLDQAAKGYVSPFHIAAIHAGLGETDEAFRWLQKAYDERSTFVVHLGWDHRFQNLYSDPRFERLLRGMKLPLPREISPQPRA